MVSQDDGCRHPVEEFKFYSTRKNTKASRKNVLGSLLGLVCQIQERTFVSENEERFSSGYFKSLTRVMGLMNIGMITLLFHLLFPNEFC